MTKTSKVAIIGLDTSHAVEFPKLMQDPAVPAEKRVSELKATRCLRFETPFQNREGLDRRTQYLESIGIPTLGEIKAPGKMEGGDVLWIDEKTVAIGRGYRTNDEGIRQFKELTKDIIDEYIIVPMPHGDGEDCCLHLMSIISFVDTDKAVVYSKYMPVFFREYLIEKGITLIECGDEEYDYLGTNVLCVAPGKCITIAGNPEITAKMRNAGIDVTTYEGKELSYRGTGGPTCLTCPLYRI